MYVCKYMHVCIDICSVFVYLGWEFLLGVQVDCVHIFV